MLGVLKKILRIIANTPEGCYLYCLNIALRETSYDLSSNTCRMNIRVWHGMVEIPLNQMIINNNRYK
jgi:hypothetical protein